MCRGSILQVDYHEVPRFPLSNTRLKSPAHCCQQLLSLVTVGWCSSSCQLVLCQIFFCFSPKIQRTSCRFFCSCRSHYVVLTMWCCFLGYCRFSFFFLLWKNKIKLCRFRVFLSFHIVSFIHLIVILILLWFLMVVNFYFYFLFFFAM